MNTNQKNFPGRMGLMGLMLSCFLLATPARSATVVSTNSAGQIEVSTDLTNMTQLLAALKGEVTANAPASVSTFASTVLGYFTSFNAALEPTFAEARGYAWAGADSIDKGKVNLANSLGISYELGALLGNTNKLGKRLSLETLTRNSGVAGTIVSQSVGLGLNFQVHDVLLVPFVHGGYDFQADKGKELYGEIGVRILKALSEHTFAGVGVSAQLPESRQIFTAFAGFTF